METNTIISLLSIIGIDLVLAGDNAVVIGMASRNLPMEKRKVAILCGTIGAVLIRILLTFIAVKILKVPLLMAIGGLLLIWVAIKLLIEDNEAHNVRSGKNIWQAIWTIIIADVIMGVDNIIAIAGASHGNTLLIFIGLAISIPIVVWCSQFISTVMNKFPAVVYIGAGLVAYTASIMITNDPIINRYLISDFIWILEVNTVLFVITIGKWWKGKGLFH